MFNKHLQEVVEEINSRSAKRVVVQVPEGELAASIRFQAQLRREIPKETSVYILCDTNKSSCCLDIIGALHVDYDLLVHFGRACFSEELSDNHLYYFPSVTEEVDYSQVVNMIKQNEIDAVMVDQTLYREALNNAELIATGVDIMRQPLDREGREHFALGYYRSKEVKNVLLVGFSEEEEEKLTLQKDKLKAKVFSTRTSQEVSLNSKLIMKRLYLINRIKELRTFGILVKNANTKFCQESIEYCKQLLSTQHRQYYMFMMNNLNEVKLGNFPEIEAYVVISCHNCSLFNEADMHKLVITPFDLTLAFSEDTPFGNYDFDLHNLPQASTIAPSKKQQPSDTTIPATSQALMKQQNEVSIQHIFQTLDYYRDRSFKGIDYSEPKEIKAMTKGKVGLAEEYKPMQ